MGGFGLRDCGGEIFFFFGCDVPGIWMVALEGCVCDCFCASM